LLEAMEAAEREEQYAFGVRWFREATAQLGPAERQRLTEAVKASQSLYWTRSLLRP
jgi:hypothetical protein